ncbi:MAG: 4-hydroxythreonine-4-phosphate dehydrogenase PdxA [Acidobacteria bacterium]|nr:4-hydroxythreonine-4-phosphate dehydrogenase PdxA [Acidobacteriota bacterium]
MTNRLTPLPRVGITMGDPAGIGPEIAARASARPEVLGVCRPVLIGDPAFLLPWMTDSAGPLLERAQDIPHLTPAPVILSTPRSSLAELIRPGIEQAAAGRLAEAAIRLAVSACLAGELEAMATAPINKASFSLAGLSFPGHTEFLAHLTGCEDFAMAFISPRLRVALLTTHLALAEVPAAVRRQPLERLIRLVDRELKVYGMARPRLALAGINPHAGEGGLFGDEERREMAPAVEACRAEGIDVSGPYPGDTVFLRAVRGEFDLVISCYHDQGLIPVKCFSFGEAVNVTLGLPLIRTSVDHGTAFDIAGRGVADESSLVAAILLAADLAGRRIQQKAPGVTADAPASERLRPPS